MEAFDNSNGATLDNLNQDIFQKSTAPTDNDLKMDIKNTNITSPSLDNLNNIQSYTIDNQKTSEIIDQNRISHGDFIFDEKNQHSQVRNIAPFETNGKKTEFITTDNFFGPESNVDDDTTGTPIVVEFNAKNEICDETGNRIDIICPDELVAPHGIHFENINYLKTVEEGEECDMKRDVDVADHRQHSFDSAEFESEQKILSADIPEFESEQKIFSADIPFMDPVKTMSAATDLTTGESEKIEDPIEDPAVAENVIIPESGEESEDEWKYIKVKPSSNDNETQERIIDSQETLESQNICPDLVNDNQSQDDEIARIEELSLSEADMASQLNPDAKEFIPTTPSPTNVTPLNSLDIGTLNSAMAALHFENDQMVSQSPRKGMESTLVNIAVPAECDFLTEISKRPAELDTNVKQELRPGSSSSQCSYQEMNLKEAMHGDEKQEYAPDVLTSPDQGIDEGNLTNGDHEEFIDILNKSMRNQDPMNASFYNDGTSNSNNPFAVDLNAVHPLPTSDEENEDDTKPAYSVLQADASGTTYAFEDTEFGMSDFIDMDRSDMQNGANHLSQQSQEVITTNLTGNSTGESQVSDVDTIVGAVQEMISENMAVLNECDLESASLPKAIEAETVPLPQSESDPLPEKEIHQLPEEETHLLPEEETHPLPEAEEPLPEAETEPLPEAETVPLSEAETGPLPKVEAETLPQAENVQSPISENVPLFEVESSNFSTLGAEVPEVGSNLIAAQYEELVQQSIAAIESESIVVNQSQTDIVATEPVVEAILKPETAAVADVAAKPKPKAAADSKSKSTTSTTKKVSTVTTAKPKGKSISQTDTIAAKTAPLPRPRTVSSQPNVKPIEKKPSSTTALKKPVNGDVKTTTSTATTKRPMSSTTTVRSTTSTRPITSTVTSTTTKVTSTRVITKTSQATSAVPDAAKRALTSKPTTTTSVTSRVRPASEKTTTTTTTRSPISKVATSATDKLSKDTANKLQTAASRAPVLSPRTATTTSQRSGSLAAKKVDATKSPTAPAPIKRPTIPSTLNPEKRPPVSTATSKVLPTQKRPISAVNKNRTSTETVKKAASPLKKITKPSTPATATSAKESKPQENGNESNGIESHALNDEPNEISSANDNVAVNNEQEPIIM